MAPLVSVIIPCFDRSTDLARALGSVLGQDEVDIEVLVGDDGSTEDLALVVAATGDARVRLCRREVNGGIGAGRNVAVAAASAPYLAFLDSDDEWLPHHLSSLLRVLHAAEPPVVAACSSFEMRYADGRVDVRRPEPRSDIVRHIVHGADLAAGSTMLIRADWWWRVGPWSETIRRAEDYEWFLRFGFLGLAVAVAPEVTAVVHADDGQRLDERTLRVGMVEVLHRHGPELRRRDPALLRALRAKFREERGWAAWRNGRYLSSAWHVALALALEPGPRGRKLAGSAWRRARHRVRVRLDGPERSRPDAAEIA